VLEIGSSNWSSLCVLQLIGYFCATSRGSRRMDSTRRRIVWSVPRSREGRVLVSLAHISHNWLIFFDAMIYFHAVASLSAFSTDVGQEATRVAFCRTVSQRLHGVDPSKAERYRLTGTSLK